jgi:hypothetical protein
MIHVNLFQNNQWRLFMKTSRLFLALVVLILASLACQTVMGGDPPNAIVGTWEGTYQKDSIGFVFESTGDMFITINGKEVGRGQYAVDYSTNPMELDLHYNDGMDVYLIIEFTDSNTMRMENSDSGDPRPTGFSDFAVLTRVTP